jgi:hypothetical protein
LGTDREDREAVLQGKKKIAFVSSVHGQRSARRNEKQGAAVEKKKQSLHYCL